MTISYLMDVFPRSLGLGYDIACSFSRTVKRSCIGPKAKADGLRLVIPAFHAHAHNRQCQLDFHILMSAGFGLEGLETCERVFSGSNAVARLTHHATAFHRWQFIDMYFNQWDTDKYENLASFLLNNYRQALDVLHDMPIHIQTILSGRHVSDTQFSQWLAQEHDYLCSKQSEPETDTLSIEYVELIDKYEAAQHVLAASTKCLLIL